MGINVLLTLLSNRVMAGLIAFIFSTFVITFLGEIFPQAYFSRHALNMASLFYPVLCMAAAMPLMLEKMAWRRSSLS